jgi:uncharacterized protein
VSLSARSRHLASSGRGHLAVGYDARYEPDGLRRPALGAGIEPVVPAIWVLRTHAVGDNAQCVALAGAIGHPFRTVDLGWPAESRTGDRNRLTVLLSDSVQGKDRRAALGLSAPWPLVVICCGRRAGRAAFWIKDRSGGVTKVVAIGRARRSLRDYDLLVALPQFLVPDRANVIRTPMVLAPSRPVVETVCPSGLISIPKPWFTLLLGGRVKQFVVSEGSLKRVAMCAQMAADRYGGSVVVSTSRRTPSSLLTAVEAVLNRPYVYRWSGADAQNPYVTLLQQSAALFITADSISMIRDACAFGAPTYIVECPERIDPRRFSRRFFYHLIRRIGQTLRALGASDLADKIDRAQDWLHAERILRYPRDLRRFHSKVYEMRLAEPATSFDSSAIATRCSINNATDESGLRAVVNTCRSWLGKDMRRETESTAIEVELCDFSAVVGASTGSPAG